MLTCAGSFSSAIASFDIKAVTQETLAAVLVELAGTKVLAVLVQKYLLYWHKSTCFNGTKVLALLVQKYLLYW